jgi:hypothetical protein
MSDHEENVQNVRSDFDEFVDENVHVR